MILVEVKIKRATGGDRTRDLCLTKASLYL